MFVDNLLDGFEGLLLIVFLLSFIYNVLKKSDFSESFNDIDDKLKLTSNFKILIWLIISSLTLYFGAEFLEFHFSPNKKNYAFLNSGNGRNAMEQRRKQSLF